MAFAASPRRWAAVEATLDPQRILTDAGERLVTLYATDDPDVIEAAVDMGPVAAIDAAGRLAPGRQRPDAPGAAISASATRTRSSLVDDVAVVDLLTLGKMVPDINLEIVEAGPEPHAITMRVHERGAGITEACGTGACASAWAATSWGLVRRARRRNHRAHGWRRCKGTFARSHERALSHWSVRRSSSVR